MSNEALNTFQPNFNVKHLGDKYLPILKVSLNLNINILSHPHLYMRKLKI